MSKITYHQQISYCGKSHCRRCREGIGHGPYWYAYQTVNGRTIRTYVGKQPPSGVLPAAGEGGPPPRAIRAVIQIFALGTFRLWRRSRNWGWLAVPDTEWSDAKALLGYLISCPARAASRNQVHEALWPDLREEATKLQLERAAAALRQVVQPPRKRKGQGELMHWDGEWLQLADQTQVWVDADAFEALLSQGRASTDPAQTEQLLEETLLLYGGDYLPEEGAIPRIQARRESLQRNWIGLLLELAVLRSARESPASAIDTLDRLLAVDPANEAAVQRLVTLLAQSGRRAEALRVYQRCGDALWREFGIRPSEELQALNETIRRGEDVKPPWHERN